MMMGFGLLLPIALLLILAYALGWLPGRSDQGRKRSAGRDALDILRERYARGEIERDEFERIQQDLRG
ncbi:MAG: SHOCT domain-containing protein [Anaerolineales bacterium]